MRRLPRESAASHSIKRQVRTENSRALGGSKGGLATEQALVLHPRERPLLLPRHSCATTVPPGPPSSPAPIWRSLGMGMGRPLACGGAEDTRTQTPREVFLVVIKCTPSMILRVVLVHLQVHSSVALSPFILCGAAIAVIHD